MRKTVAVLLGLLVVAGGIVGTNYLIAQQPLEVALSTDPRNHVVGAWSYLRYGVQPAVLVFDLRDVKEASPTDVMRAFLQYAKAQKDRDFERVVLAYRGDARFQIPGSYFAELGAQYGVQNPVYTLRTFPQHVQTLDGRDAFPTWTGGLLGVVGKQMDDLNSFVHQWVSES